MQSAWPKALSCIMQHAGKGDESKTMFSPNFIPSFDRHITNLTRRSAPSRLTHHASCECRDTTSAKTIVSVSTALK